MPNKFYNEQEEKIKTLDTYTIERYERSVKISTLGREAKRRLYDMIDARRDELENVNKSLCVVECSELSGVD